MAWRSVRWYAGGSVLHPSGSATTEGPEADHGADETEERECRGRHRGIPRDPRDPKADIEDLREVDDDPIRGEGSEVRVVEREVRPASRLRDSDGVRGVRELRRVDAGRQDDGHREVVREHAPPGADRLPIESVQGARGLEERIRDRVPH